MRLIVFSIVFAAVVSCKSLSDFKSLSGEYYKTGSDHQDSLLLRRDSSFILIFKSFEANSRCTGKWTILAKDTILLRCDDSDPEETIANNYMSERKRKAIVLDRHNLKIDNIIFQKSEGK